MSKLKFQSKPNERIGHRKFSIIAIYKTKNSIKISRPIWRFEKKKMENLVYKRYCILQENAGIKIFYTSENLIFSLTTTN